jgi:asparagine synthase (glutamine-hydrolysing)
LTRGLQSLLGRMPEGKDRPVLEWLRRARRFTDTADPDPVRRQARWMRLADEAELDRLLGPAPHEPIAIERLVAEGRAALGDADPVNAMLAADLAVELPGDMLVKVDRTSMAHALECRAPFLDQRVVEWAFALPGAMKLGRSGGRPIGKRILRSAFADRLPAAVFERPKRGFEMPVAAMLAGPAAGRLAAATDAAALKRQGLFDAAVIAGWRDALASGRRDTSWQLWTVLAFQEWARLHRRPEALA